MRRRAALFAATAGLLVLAGTAGGGGGSVTLSARPLTLPAAISPQYEGLILSGTVSSGQSNEDVTIQANECTFPGWHDVVGAHTEGGGVYRVTFGAQSRTAFRAKWKGAVSRPITVRTRPGLNIEQLGRRLWSVGMLAQRSFLDRRGRLQRFDRRTSRWVTVKSFRFTEKFSVPAGSWTYARFRARVPRGAQVRAYVPNSEIKPCYLAAYSVILKAR